MRRRESLLLAAVILATSCTTAESATRTRTCRASTTDTACRACCEDAHANDRTNAHRFASPGDCRFILRYWVFLQ